MYFNQTPVFISTSRAFFTNDKEREIAEEFQKNLLASFVDSLHMDIRDTSTSYHLSYVYWILRTSLDEDNLYDTPLDTKTLNDALKTGSLGQNGNLDPMAFFIDVMFLDEPDFIEKYRGSVKIDRDIPTISALLEQATGADHHASSEQTKKVKVKCPQELKGKSSPAVVTYLKSMSSDAIKQSKLAKEFLDYAVSHNRHYPAVHMDEIKKIAAMADRVKVIPGRPGQPSRLFVASAKNSSKMNKIEQSIIKHFGANK